jgi:4'-phosphopantetheinyl transferase EntD
MLALGKKDAALLSGLDREPLWPPDIVGSISHSSHWSICAATSSTTVAGLGVDVERLSAIENLPRELLFTKSEQDWLASRPIQHQTDLEILIFSAKESIYKALFPHCRRHIDYLEVELRIDVQNCRFQVKYYSKKIGKILYNFLLQGRFCWFDNHIWTAVTLLKK